MIYLPRSEAFPRVDIPDPDKPAMTSRVEKTAIRANCDSRHSLWVTFKGSPHSGCGGIDDLDLFPAATSEERTIRGDGEGSTAVELLQWLHASIAPLQGVGSPRHHWIRRWRSLGFWKRRCWSRVFGAKELRFGQGFYGGILLLAPWKFLVLVICPSLCETFMFPPL